jgi:hypothetical protein
MMFDSKSSKWNSIKTVQINISKVPFAQGNNISF